MKLNKKELAWVERLKKTLEAAPESMKNKGRSQEISSYTIGDNSVVLFDEQKYSKYISDNETPSMSCVGQIVDESGSEIETFYFPFSVEGTSG